MQTRSQRFLPVFFFLIEVRSNRRVKQLFRKCTFLPLNIPSCPHLHHLSRVVSVIGRREVSAEVVALFIILTSGYQVVLMVKMV
jgi:hypothetical protein